MPILIQSRHVYVASDLTGNLTMKQRESGLPFDDFRNLVRTLPSANEEAAFHTVAQFSTKYGTQSKVRSLCEWYSRWSGRSPVVHRPLMTLFCGTHALTNALDRGANSNWLLANVTEVAEGANVINRLCHQQEMGLKLFDLALQIPVEDISIEAALDEKACAGTIAFGMEAIAGGSDLLAVCAIEDGVNVSNAAILALFRDHMIEPVSDVDQREFSNAVSKAVELAKGHAANPLEVLRRLGGRETAAICGAILAARTEHIPTVVGGVTGLAALVILKELEPEAISHCVIASRFADPSLDEIGRGLGVPVVMNASFQQRIMGCVVEKG